jgi:hypothetical protein
MHVHAAARSQRHEKFDRDRTEGGYPFCASMQESQCLKQNVGPTILDCVGPICDLAAMSRSYSGTLVSPNAAKLANHQRTPASPILHASSPILVA